MFTNMFPHSHFLVLVTWIMADYNFRISKVGLQVLFIANVACLTSNATCQSLCHLQVYCTMYLLKKAEELCMLKEDKLQWKGPSSVIINSTLQRLTLAIHAMWPSFGREDLQLCVQLHTVGVNFICRGTGWCLPRSKQ